MTPEKAKVALVFDWMTTSGGAERVNLVLHKLFSKAPIFTSVYNPKKLKGFESSDINTSFIQKLPFAKTKHQYYLDLMPYAFEQFDLSDYDIVISSSHSCAKGIITKPETLHICYCHSPMRYAWDDWHNYVNNYKMNPILKFIGKKHLHKLRIWDRLSAERVDHFIANSNTTKKRIAKYYKKFSKIIHPMIEVKDFELNLKNNRDYYLAVGRLTPYKKFGLIVDSFNKNGKPLKIVGNGVEYSQLKKRAKSNIEFLQFIPDEELKQIYGNAKAFIFPQIEDFGITPLEAMATGTPVIAFNQGGALETVVENETGIFFDKQTVSSLNSAIEKFEKIEKTFDRNKIRKHVEKFDTENFENQLMDFIAEKWESHQKQMSNR